MPPGDRFPPPQIQRAQQMLREAFNLHQHGQLQQAQQLYEAVLKIAPKNADALHLLGVLSAQSGNHKKAADLIGRAIAANPGNAAFYFNRGSALQHLDRLEEALDAYNKGLALKADVAEVFNNRGNVLQALGRLEPALASYDKAAALQPSNHQALNNRGSVLQALHRYEEAIASFDRAIAVKPDYVLALCNRADVLQALGRHEAAITGYDCALALLPDQAGAHHNRANALQSLGRFEEAVASYERAVLLSPESAESHHNLGAALRSAGRPADSVARLDAALQLAPTNADIHMDRGLALQELKRFDDALTSYEAALALGGGSSELYNNRGAALHALKRFEEAIVSFEKALQLRPDNADAHTNLGNAFQELRRFEEALVQYDASLALNPNNPRVYNNRGVTLQSLWRLDDAVASYDKALTLAQESADALQGRGNALHLLSRHDEAAASFDRALAAQPDFLFGTFLHAKMQICDWTALAENLSKLSADIVSGKKSTPPFAAITLLDEPEVLLAAARTWAETKYPNPAPPKALRTRTDKIRVGYYSSDYHDHATTYLIAEMLEKHDKQRFEIFGFSFAPPANDRMRRRVAAAFDQFIDIGGTSDREVAQMSADMGIDIAVDLKGYTGGSRLGLFAERCAPIQVNYLGFPGTLGARFIDYIIADATLIPPEAQPGYSEKVVYLPGSYQANDSTRKVAERVFARGELGLPENGFVFCCFNNNFKIFPSTFASWMRILKAVDGSVLWLLEDNPTAGANLRAAAIAEGVDSARLVFAKRMPTDEHLARQRCADLFLDNLPCNAHTTASDALWVDLPLLTLPGRAFAGRVAASLLNALDMPELIASSADDYEAKAIWLASNPDALAALKAKLTQNKKTSALFDGARLARNIEAAYEAMYARAEAGLAPDHIYISEQ